MRVHSGGQLIEARGLPAFEFTGNVPAGYDGGGMGSQPFFSDWMTDSGEGVNLSPDAVFDTQPAVRTVTDFRAKNIGQVPLHSYSTTADNRKRERDSPLARLLLNPAPNVTGFEFMYKLMLDLDLWDRFAALLSWDKKIQGWRLDRLPPRSWRFVRNGLDEPQAIRSAAGGTTGKTVGLEQVLWIDGYPSASRSPMEALKGLLIEEAESAASRLSIWKNRARIPHWISRSTAAGNWTPEARDNFKQSWQAYAAGGGRTGKTPVLEDDMKLHELTMMTAVDGQQIEARILGLRQVAAFYHTPSVFVGDPEGATHANVGAFREHLYADTFGPDFAKIQQAFNQRVVPYVDPTRSEFAEFAVGTKMTMSFDQQADIYHKALSGVGYRSVNEVRREQNLPPSPNPEHDEPIIPINVRPVDAAVAR